MHSYSGKIKVSHIFVVEVGNLVSTPQITEPLPCTPQNIPFTHSFFILLKCLTPIFVRYLLFNLRLSLLFQIVLLTWPGYWFSNLLFSHLPPYSCLHLSKRPNQVSSSILIPYFLNTSTEVKAHNFQAACQGFLYPTYCLMKHLSYLLKRTKWFLLPGPRLKTYKCFCCPHSPSSDKSIYSSCLYISFNYLFHRPGLQRFIFHHPFILSFSRYFCVYLDRSTESSHPTIHTPSPRSFVIALIFWLSPGLKLQFSSVTQSCTTFCNPMNHSMSDLPVNHQLLEHTETHAHRVGDAI